MHQQEEMNRAVFIDKDGTLIPDIPYNANPTYIMLREGAGEALKAFQEQGYLLIMITNQSGVARGYITEDEIRSVRNRIDELLKVNEVHLDGFYYCPHHPEGKVSEFAKECDCRKPESGMIKEAARDHKVNLGKSWMIGDTSTDIIAAKTSGCTAIFFEKRYEPYNEQFKETDMKPDYVVRSWEEVKKIIGKS